MSSTDDHIGIGTCLDIVCQAFRDGGAIIEKVKNKRSQKKAPPPPRLLEETIDAAPDEIEKEKHRGIARFGNDFEKGDVKTIIALQHIALQLQSSFLEKLRNAAFDDDFKITDFSPLIETADVARDRTIATLSDFRQRLLDAHNNPTIELQPVSTTNSSTSNLELSQRQTLSEPSRSSTEVAAPLQHVESAPKARHKTWTRDFTAPDEDTASGAEEVHHQRNRSSILHFLKHHRANSGTDIKHQPTVPEEAPSIASIRHASTSPANMPMRSPPHSETSEPTPTSDPKRLSPTTSFKQQEWEDSGSDLWSSKTSMERRDTAIAPDMFTSTSSLPLQALQAQRTRTNTNMSQFSVAVPIPTPENDYLGFCKGAWKLQNGDRRGSMQKCRDGDAWTMHASAGPAKQYLACATPKCAFKSNINNANADLIWDKVFSAESKGIKFRWRFLAKSHVHQRIVIKNNFTFKCLFCTFLGEKTAMYSGMDTLLEHLSEHRGQLLNDVILYKAGCINDHVARIDEDFDINLWPLTQEENRDRPSRPDWLTDEPSSDPKSDAHDSVISPAEPWNEGLSDFHYGGIDSDRMGME